jgi:hypothetical protein
MVTRLGKDHPQEMVRDCQTTHLNLEQGKEGLTVSHVVW